MGFLRGGVWRGRRELRQTFHQTVCVDRSTVVVIVTVSFHMVSKGHVELGLERCYNTQRFTFSDPPL